MGRSASCLKIITCGSDARDEEELEVPEIKGDRRGWSFRKRSARHRVLNNSVVSENPVQIKETPESIDTNIKATTNFDALEKVSAIQCVAEKPQLSTPSEVKAPESVVATMTDIFEEEASIVIIQTAIRAYMAQKELIKLKKLIKMQAAVRGHLVRRHAVGTLRCVQAIVKMQALVRARYASQLVEGSNIRENEDVVNAKDEIISKASVKKNVKNQAAVTYISIEKLLNNRFAQQLLVSTPKTKPIHIKCDTSKPDSAWQWLERWMAVSSTQQSPVMEVATEEQSNEKNENLIPHSITGLTPEVLSQPTSSHEETEIVTVDNGSDILASAVKNSKVEELSVIPVVNQHSELSEAENQTTSNDAADLDSHLPAKINEICEMSNAERDSVSVSIKSEGEIEQPRHSGKRVAPEQLETEAKKPAFGSKRASNPAFTAAQSKFEELSSAAISSGSVSSSYKEDGINSKVTPVPMEEAGRTASVMEEICSMDNSASGNLLAQIGGSECGTELSISSTLDSPDREEVAEKGKQMQDDKACKTDGVEHSEVVVNMDRPEESVDPIGKLDNSVVVAESLQPEQESKNPSLTLNTETTAEAIPQQHTLSPEASPRSHMTFPESQGTPASQASVNTKGSRAQKNISSHKRKSFSAGKKSPSNPNQESAANNSKELPKDRKSTRRRSLKPEDAEEEPRDSTSNSTNSIPHFMQATESARAKLNANNSPRSSPDVLDRDLYNKKRQSLPGANGRQGSPRVHRSSQAQQGGKANDTQVQERKWVR